MTLKRWEAICRDNAKICTWDTLVECELSVEEGDIVSKLGYYGHAVEETHAQRIDEGLPWDENIFSIVYDGVDGSMETRFATVERAKGFIEQYVGAGAWTSSDTAFHSDYAHYYLHGFTLKDAGIDWQDHVA